MADRDAKKVLLLGMVYSDEMSPKRGQEFRDRVRCAAVETKGYNVYSLDDKHDDQAHCVAGKHCKANFADSRRMTISIHKIWGKQVSFDVIILDYFFSPVGWARERWSDGFWKETIPMLAKSGILTKGGELWLPHLSCVTDSLDEFKEALALYYSIDFVENPLENPLYLATEDVESELIRCPDLLTNTTQIKPLTDHSSTPFYVLRVKDFDISPVSVAQGSRTSSPKSKAKKRAIDFDAVANLHKRTIVCK